MDAAHGFDMPGRRHQRAHNGPVNLDGRVIRVFTMSRIRLGPPHFVAAPPLVYAQGHQTAGTLNGYRVEQFAIRDRSIQFCGHGRLFRGRRKLRDVGPVPRLALGRGSDDHVVLLHCDARWRVLGVSEGHATLREAKKAAEWFYIGISKRWVPTGYTRSDARRALDRIVGPKKCSLCLRAPDDVEFMVEIKKRKLAICDVCIRELDVLAHSKM